MDGAYIRGIDAGTAEAWSGGHARVVRAGRRTVRASFD